MVGIETPEMELVLDARAKLGEEPIFVGEDNALFWIDGYAPSINRLDTLTGENCVWPLPEIIGSYALYEDRSGAVLALASGLYDFSFATARMRLRHAAPYDRSILRFNDGRCDRAGRFWVGTLRLDETKTPKGVASVYRLDERGLVEMIPDVSLTNGIAWSPDGRAMYVADRPNWRILAFDFDLSSGSVANRRTFTSVREGWRPDGAAVDTQGGYWVALLKSGLIARFLPSGELDRLVRAPVSTAVMVTFGGPELDMLYVTSGSHWLSEEERVREPLAGAIWRFRPGVKGMPEPLFRHC